MPYRHSRRPPLLPRHDHHVRLLGTVDLVDTGIKAVAKPLEDLKQLQQQHPHLDSLLTISLPRLPMELQLQPVALELVAFKLVVGRKLGNESARQVWGRRIDNLHLVGPIERDAKPVARRRGVLVSENQGICYVYPVNSSIWLARMK